MQCVIPNVATLYVMRLQVSTEERKCETSRGVTREMGVMEVHMVSKVLYLGVRVGSRGLGGVIDRANCSYCREGTEPCKGLIQ